MKHSMLFTLVLAFSAGWLAAAELEVVFEDPFDTKLAEGWTWLREDTKAWRLREGALEIRNLPGNAQTVQNAILRPALDRSRGTYVYEVTVTSLAVPTEQYEQAGITWYQDDKPVLKFVKERIDGKLYVFPGRVPMDKQTVTLRLVVGKERWVARFRPEGQKDFQTAAEGAMPSGEKDQVSIQCYHGPSDKEHWVRFDDFRILRMAD